MKELTLKNIERITGGELKNYDNNTNEARCVVIDSRKMINGGIFIATPGNRVDGHDFIPEVSHNGALGIICEKEPSDCAVPYILVKDSFDALRKIAAFYRSVLSTKIIGITGSVGKTSTKEMIASALSSKYRVCKTEGNFNNNIGVPLTLLSIRDEHEVAVVEMGISHFGEMSELTGMAKPDTCVITNIGECHLEALKDRDGVLKAKSEIFEGLSKDGAIFLNGDDDRLRTVKAPYNREPVFFGMGKDNDIYPSEYRSLGLLGSECVFSIKGCPDIKAAIPLPGNHMIYNAMAAILIGHEYGMEDELILDGISKAKTLGGRSNVLKTGKLVLIDDCYNANPVSMKAAIDLLCNAGTRKVAILGDMFELGVDERKLHYEIGKYAAGHGIDVIIAIGDLSEEIYKGASENSPDPSHIYHFATREDAKDALDQIIKDNDSVLVKASHGMHFEVLVDHIKAMEA